MATLIFGCGCGAIRPRALPSSVNGPRQAGVRHLAAAVDITVRPIFPAVCKGFPRMRSLGLVPALCSDVLLDAHARCPPCAEAGALAFRPVCECASDQAPRTCFGREPGLTCGYASASASCPRSRRPKQMPSAWSTHNPSTYYTLVLARARNRERARRYSRRCSRARISSTRSRI